MARPLTLRDFILRYPSSSLSPTEREALRHERELRSQESPDLEVCGMAVTDGSEDEPEVPGADASPTVPQAEAEEVAAPEAWTFHFVDPEC